jgi:hypothetical protein
MTGWKNFLYVDTLSAAYAEAGRFDEAITWQKKAVEHPEAFPAAELEKVKQRLNLYEAHKPYHEPKPEPTKPGPKQPLPAPGQAR